MNDRSYLLNRKRCNILKQRKKKAVSCRHQFVHDYSFRMPVTDKDKHIAEEETVSVLTKSEEVLKEEEVQPVTEEAAVEEEPLVEIMQEPPHEEPVQKSEPAEKKLTRKERKKQEKEEILDLLVNEPDISFFKMLVNPLECMDQVSTLDYATLSSGQRFVMNLFKWLAIGASFAMPIMKIVDINPYGFSRLNFTSTAIIAFEFALFGFVCEIIMMCALKVFCISRNYPVDKARMVSICAYGAPLETLLFVISAVLMYFTLGFGLAFLTGSVVASSYLKAYGISKANLAKKRMILGLLIFTVIFAVLFFLYAKMVGGDVIKIFRNIMNL